KNRKRTR
ncbi:Replication protein P, partial [Haemophilus influenzae]